MKSERHPATNFFSVIVFRTVIVIIAAVITLSPEVFGQTPLTARPDKGFGATGGYQTTEIDSISLQNGGVNLQIPLASLPPVAGGKLGYTLTANYNNKLWHVYRGEARHVQFEPGCPSSYSTEYVGLADGAAGWRIGGRYEVFFRDANEDYDYIEPDNQQCFGYEWYHMMGRFFKPMLRMPDGSERELVIDGYYPTYAGQRDHLKGYYQYAGGVPNNPPFSGPVRFYTRDGSFLTIIYRPAPDPVRWTLYMKDGTRVEANADGGQRTIDPNGNSILQGGRMVGGVYEEFVRDEHTDREIKWSAATYNNQTATKVEYQSVGGAWQQVYVVWGTTTVRGKAATNTRWFYQEGDSLTDFPCYVNQVLPDNQLSVVREIVFPVTEQNAPPQKYLFTYNSDTSTQATDNVQESCYPYLPPYAWTRQASPGWGEISQVTTPTGAQIQYEYVHDGVHVHQLGDWAIDFPAQNYIAKKKVLHDGQTDTWVYGISGFVNANWPTTGSVTNPDGTFHVEMYNPTNPAYSGYSGPDGSAGQLVKTSDSNGVVVHRKWKALGGLAGSYGSTNQRAVNAVVEAEFTTLMSENGLTRLKMSAKKYEHDYNGEITKVTEYDWFDPNSVTYQHPGTWREMPVDVPSGAPILRVTDTAVHNHAPNSASNNAYHRRVPDPSAIILGKPYVITIGDGTTVKSTTHLSYDGQSFGLSPIKGNLTTLSVLNDATGQWVTTGITYSARGNPTRQTDANGNATEITYGPINGFGDLYPTQTITAFGTAVARTSATTYDFSTGLPTAVTDVDNNATTITEYDILRRPIKVRNAAGTALESWTTTEYRDSTRTVVVRSDIETLGDGRQVSIQHYDRLGRVRLARTLENPILEDPYNEQHGIKVETRYKNHDTTPGDPNDPENTLGTLTLVSSPFRASTAEGAVNESTMGWTLTYVSKNGRYSETSSYGGASIPVPFGGSNTDFTGSTKIEVSADRTLATDQAGKQKISRVDAGGQLREVWEVTGSDQWTEGVSFPGHPSIAQGYKTSYTYDVLGNLTSTTQGSQVRTYTYSSLSKLTSATNPELGTTPTNGTIYFTYDANGNLTRKTDPRGVQTDYVYDQLNRMTHRNYSTPGGTPANYQAPPNVTYTYDDPAVPNAKGRLTKVSTGSGVDRSTTEFVQYDILGRVLRSVQTTDGVTYGGGSDPNFWMTYSYSLSGALLEQQYPSGRRVRTGLDSSGRVAVVQSRKNGNQGFLRYAGRITYSSAGSVSSLQLGNGRWESMQFNSRLQPTQIALGSLKDTFDQLKLNFEYGDLDGNGAIIPGTNSGNIAKQSIVVPGVGTSAGFTAVQKYDYDALNRIQIANEVLTPTSGAAESWTQEFRYDRFGNRTFHEPTTTTLPKNCGVPPNQTVCPADVPIYNPSASTSNNRLNGYQFDAAGNSTYDAQYRKFTYDAENKQRKVESLDSGGNVTGTIGEYVYDGDGKRVKKTVPNGEITIFVYDATGKLIGEFSTIVAPPQDAKVAYLTNDHLGSPRVNTDARGAIVSRHDYHPFGDEIVSATTPKRSPGVGYVDDTVRKQFTGYERDEETQLDFAQARMFGSRAGRFTSPDPSWISVSCENPQTWNRYIYVLNNPLRYSDPLGLWELEMIDEKEEEVSKDGKKKKTKHKVTIRLKPEKGDDVKSLAKQLNIKEKDAAKILAKADKDGNIQLSKVGGDIGYIFGRIESRVAEHLNDRDANPSKGDDQGWDCSKTTAFLAGFDWEGQDSGANGLDEKYVAQGPAGSTMNVAQKDLKVGDMVRFAPTGKTATHWATFLMFNKGGEPVVFSKSGISGPNEIVPTSALSGYGVVEPHYMNRSAGTGYYRKR